VSENIYAPLVMEKTIHNPKIGGPNPGAGTSSQREKITTKLKNRQSTGCYRDADSRICLDMADDILVPRWHSGSRLY
jgi:hypothetical protein